MTKLKPVKNRLLIKRLKEEEKTPSGIIIPDAAREKTLYAKVIATGPGKVNDDGEVVPVTVKPGEIILFGKYSGIEIKHEGEELLFITEDEVLAIVEEK